MIFSNGRINKNVHFNFYNKELEIVSELKYLGIYLSRSGAFNAAKKHIAEQANKALFSIIRKTRTLNLSYDVKIDLFEKTIKPILLYGCKIWGLEKNAIIERVHLKLLWIIFRLKRSTPSFMTYGELWLTSIIWYSSENSILLVETSWKWSFQININYVYRNFLNAWKWNLQIKVYR